MAGPIRTAISGQRLSLRNTRDCLHTETEATQEQTDDKQPKEGEKQAEKEG